MDLPAEILRGSPRAVKNQFKSRENYFLIARGALSEGVKYEPWMVSTMGPGRCQVWALDGVKYRLLQGPSQRNPRVVKNHFKDAKMIFDLPGTPSEDFPGDLLRRTPGRSKIILKLRT